jgi:hypothetical protein
LGAQPVHVAPFSQQLG